MRLSQNDMGYAFEYGISIAFAQHLSTNVNQDTRFDKAYDCFNRCSANEQQKIMSASREAALFLFANDTRFSNQSCSINLQSSQSGREGDVRDIIIHNPQRNEDIGISAKNRHWAVKHSRLSEQIDFGDHWFGIPSSNEYFDAIRPIFQELRNRQNQNEMWRNIPDKITRFYIPILQAFQNEIMNLYESHPDSIPGSLIRYLLGRFDYYKVIKENGDVSIMSFNLNNTLQWGRSIQVPTRIIEISPKPGSNTTLLMTFDCGWQISFRIHNASTFVEPSLKFDINIIGMPSTISRHVIRYNT